MSSLIRKTTSDLFAAPQSAGDLLRDRFLGTCDVEMRYDVTNCLAVTFIFKGTDEAHDAVWSVSRELVINSFNEVIESETFAMVFLNDLWAMTMLEQVDAVFNASVVWEFLMATLELVPVHKESTHIEVALGEALMSL